MRGLRQLRVAVMRTGLLEDQLDFSSIFELVNIPWLLTEDIQKPVQQSRGFRLELWRRYKGVISGYYGKRDIVLFRTLEKAISMAS